MSHRKELLYPPYSRIIGFQFKSKDSQKVAKVAHTFSRCLKMAEDKYPVLGPSPSTIVKMQGFYRWECMMKINPGLKAYGIEKLLDNVFDLYDKEKPRGASSVRINVNVDAIE